MSIFCLIPSVGFWRVNGKVLLDRKFYDGVKLYKKAWIGEVRVCLRESVNSIPSFGLVELDTKNTPIDFVFLSKKERINADHLKSVYLVMASCDDYRNIDVSNLCKSLNVKCINDLEYTLQTRLEINKLSSKNNFDKLKTILWLFINEKKRIKSLKLADALQANGMPAYNDYKKYFKDSSSALLYFDNRITSDMLISDKSLHNRLDALDLNLPIRLAFSGRIIAMKGADDLIKTALNLKKMNVNFTFDIFGDGELRQELEVLLVKLDLTDCVKFHGAVDYESKLIPFIQKNVDVFVCCHKQSDPSCTYIETYACGVPIIGYANKAHSGILDIVDAGWEVPIGDSKKLARIIKSINNNRSVIKKKSINARNFALEHTFEIEFQKRVKQWHEIVN